MERRTVMNLCCVTKSTADVSCEISESMGSWGDPHWSCNVHVESSRDVHLALCPCRTACCPEPSVPGLQLLIRLQYRFQRWRVWLVYRFCSVRTSVETPNILTHCVSWFPHSFQVNSRIFASIISRRFPSTSFPIQYSVLPSHLTLFRLRLWECH
jgi:hypothetical protein